MRPLRIAITHHLPFGGAGRALFDQGRQLHALGHDLTFFAAPQIADERLPFRELGAVVDVPLAFAEREGHTRWQKIANTATRLGRLVPAYMDHARQVGALVDAGGFDLLLAHNCQQFHTPMVARFVTTVPKLLYLQDPFRALYEAMPKLPLTPPPAGASLGEFAKDRLFLRDARRRARLELDSALAFDRILVNSYFSRESVRRAFNLPAEVCYLGIDTARFAPNPQPAGDYVFGVGAFNDRKSPLEVVRALARIPQPGRPRLEWSANMVDEVHVPQVEAAARESGVEFTLWRDLPDAEVCAKLTGAITLVYANKLEPFGLVPLEANACGLAVVAVAEGGVRETIRDGVNGVLVNGDPDSLAQAVVTLRDDPELRARLGVSARKEVEDRWSLAAAQERLQNTLERFMKDHQRGQA